MVRGRAWASAWAGVAVVGLGVLPACGDGGDGQMGEVVGGAVTTTTTESTTTSTTTATTTSAPSTTVPDGGVLAAGPDYHDDRPSGAGCTPGQVDRLPDGWWAGEITAADGATMDFDLVCFFAGTAAETAAAEDGVELTNDYHVRNDNPRTFAVEFPSTRGTATCIDADVRPFACTVGDLLGLYPGVGHSGDVGGREVIAYPIVWLHVTAGTPDHLWVQYTP